LAEIKENYADERRTKILAQGVKNLEDKDLIPEEENILVLTDGGYVKRFSPTRHWQPAPRRKRNVYFIAARGGSHKILAAHFNSQRNIFLY